jgi:hypothetical protein
MGKLHELLAVEGDLAGTAKKLAEEAIKTFSKPNHFLSSHRHVAMFNAEEQSKVIADEHQNMDTTVTEKLDYLAEAVAKYFDAVLQKEMTNQTAVADLKIGSVTIGNKIPATFLLGMENKLKELRQVYESIPTLAPGIPWKLDETLGKGVYRMEHADEKIKTAKTFQFRVLYEATDKHPAQIEKWEDQIPVGKIITNVTSGMLSPADKSALLGRLDRMIQAVKAARCKANMADVVEESIGTRMFQYIHEGQ